MNEIHQVKLHWSQCNSALKYRCRLYQPASSRPNMTDHREGNDIFLSFLSLLGRGGGAWGPEGILHSHLRAARIHDLSHKERRLHRNVPEAKEVKNEGVGRVKLNCSHSQTEAVIVLCQIL